jgi:hypothetical protein
MQPKLVSLKLETCHANEDGVAWYAYLASPSQSHVWGHVTPQVAVQLAKKAYTGHAGSVEKNSLGVAEWAEGSDAEEVPNKLSEHTNLRRYYVASAG